MRPRIRHMIALAALLPAAAGAALAQRPGAAASAPADTVAAALAQAPSDTVAAPVDSLARVRTLPELPKPKSTAVDIDREAPVAPPMHYYDKHGEPLETPVRFLAELDTVTKVKSGPKYQAFNGVSIGANFFDAIMMIAGQQRASFDLWADCSIHNWFFPVLEAGIGFAGAHPDDGRCHYKQKAAPYIRLGFNYNFLYKSNPDYQFHIGLRAGWSSFGYDIYDIMPGSQYYTADGPRNVAGLRSTAFYGQAVAGLKVKLWRGLFMGWSFRYSFGIHQSYSDPDYPAWFTPGKGTGGGGIGATFSIGWTIGQQGEKTPPAPTPSE